MRLTVLLLLLLSVWLVVTSAAGGTKGGKKSGSKGGKKGGSKGGKKGGTKKGNNKATPFDCNGQVKIITCSRGRSNKYKECSIGQGNTITNVQLVRILPPSTTTCEFQQNRPPAAAQGNPGDILPGYWGWTDSHIWIDNGCKGKWKVCYNKPSCDGTLERVNCRSNNGQKKECCVGGNILSRPVILNSGVTCIFYPGAPPPIYLPNGPGIFGFQDKCMWSINCNTKFQVCSSDIDKCGPEACKNGGQCVKKRGVYQCRCAPGFSGDHCDDRTCVCMASGDPHYKTFTGRKFNFQGPCCYLATFVESQTCGRFKVIVCNIPSLRRPSVSITESVTIYVNDHEIYLGQGSVVRVGGIDRNILDIYESPDGNFTIQKDGSFMVVRTPCKREARFDGRNKAIIEVDPDEYQAINGGLCSDCDLDPSNDFIARNGSDLIGVRPPNKRGFEFGQSWYEPDDGDDPDECGPLPPPPECTPAERETIQTSSEYCGPFSDPNGRFGECIALMGNSTIYQDFLSDCEEDLCVFKDDDVERKRYQCMAGGTLLAVCYQYYGDDINDILFRTELDCPFPCGDNMVYSPRVSTSDPTCREPNRLPILNEPFMDGCICMPGFVYEIGADRKGRCIPKENCGCYIQVNGGMEIAVGASYTDQDCQKKYVCTQGPDAEVVDIGGCDSDKHFVCRPRAGAYDCVCDTGYIMVADTCVKEPDCEGRTRVRNCKSQRNEEKICRFNANIVSLTIKKLFCDECFMKPGPQPEDYTHPYYYVNGNKLVVNNGCKIKVKVCLEGNPCDSGPCKNGGSCRPTKKGFKCTCPNGWSGKRCGRPDRNPCDSGPCKNGGSCRPTKKGFKCTCPNGWSGKRCGRPDRNPCDSGPCKNGGSCRPTKKGFKCTCPNGWSGKRCGRPDRNPCDSGPCKNGGSCRPTKKGFKCTCPNGWSGKRCGRPDRNPCDSGPCKNGGSCRPTKKGFKCTCPNGWSGKRCGRPDRNPCDSGPCKNGGSCRPTKKGFKCTCPNGWSGKRCGRPDRNPCDSGPCKNGGSCRPTKKGFKCTCPNGWSGKRCGRPDRNPCDSGPCKNGGSCRPTKKGFKCTCPNGWSGKRCGRPDRNPCDSGPCKNGGSCRPTKKGFKCTCPNGWSGKRCGRPDRNPCDSGPCKNGGSCRPTKKGFKCTCPNGWSGKRCGRPDRNPCDSGPCKNGGSCRPTKKGFKCTCPNGWSGKRCGRPDIKELGITSETKGNPCKPNPCGHRGTCKNLGNGLFECCCTEGWTGKFCEEMDLPPKPPGPHKECIDRFNDPKGLRYYGTAHTTPSGHVCQTWTVTSPWRHAYHTHKRLISERNYCRNILHGYRGLDFPWCYTTDPNKRMAYCAIPYCDDGTPFPPPPIDEGCSLTSDGSDYEGPVFYTRLELMCLKWPDYPDNFCRNPGGQRKRPFCHTRFGIRDCDINVCGTNPPTGVNSCSVRLDFSHCATIVTLDGDCTFQNSIYGQCDFTIYKANSSSDASHYVHMPDVTRALQPPGSIQGNKYVDTDCHVSFEVIGPKMAKVNVDLCFQCMKKQYESFMKSIADGTNTCPA